MKSKIALALALSVLALLPLLPARPDSLSPLDDAPPPVRTALLEGDYEKALELLAGLESSEPQRADLWLLLRGLVHATRGRPADAERAFGDVERRFPDSAWRTKARFGRAEALRLLRRFGEAEAIVAEEASRLLSETRRRELSGLAVKLADARLDPPRDEHGHSDPPDEARALSLYTQILALEPPADVVAHVQMQRGFALERTGQFAEAVGAFRAFLDGRGAAALDLASAEARLHLGRSLLALGRRLEARRTFEDLAAEIPASAEPLAERRGDALLDVASTFGEQSADEAPLAVAAIRRFLEATPGHPGAFAARLRIARIEAGLGRLDGAIAAIDELLAQPTATLDEKRRDAATQTQAEGAFLRGTLLRRQAKPELASASFADCIARDPTGPRWAEAQAAMVECELDRARIARADGDEPAARAELAGFISRHPLDGRVAGLRFEIGELFALQAAELLKDAGAPPPPEPLASARALQRQAIDEWQRLARTHPGSNEASEGLFRAGLLFHDELAELERALETWKACSFGPRAGDAAARLREMTTPALAVATKRSFRTDEAAQVELTVRNVPEVRVDLHRLDLDAYFRKFLGVGGVDSLDLDLIAPERSYPVKVEGYSRLKQFRLPLPIEMDGPGAYVVAVVAEGQRATTLVLRSDVDVIVKASRRDVLVFAEDRRTGEPAPGVDLLLDLGEGEAGARRQLSGRTGEEGVFQARTEDLGEAPRVRLLARRDGHFAATGVDFEGFTAAAPLTPRGLVFTDRPAYRPGERVHARALVREVRDGRLHFEPGAKWTLDLLDPQGRLVRSDELELGEYGALHGSFELDALAPVGTWRLNAARVDGPTFTGAFEVQEYQLERIRVDLELPRRVYYRGETIEIAAVARWQHGAPVAGAPLRLALPDERVFELRTDAEGRATATFETRDQPSETTLAFSATLAEEGISGAATAFVAVREFTIALELPRRVVLAGERFPVAFSTALRDGSPVGRGVKLTLLRRDERGGGEVRALEREVESDAKDGRARVELALEKGGSYVVRADATDRFGNPIRAEGSLRVSGADDDVKLRLLADTTSLETGERTKVRLVNRAGAGLLLLTWEGDHFLRFKVLRVEEGTRELDVGAEDEQVPGFVLGAAAMRGQTLHQASVPFRVTRELRLTVTPRATTARPGSETTIDLAAADPLGNPVQAEVSLAVIDDSLLRMFADPTPPPSSVFRLDARDPVPHRTDSSCSFAYQGATREVAAAVITEELRRLAQQRWNEEKAQVAQSLEALGYSAEDAAGEPRGRYAGPADSEAPQQEAELNDFIGLGGGAGGQGGGKFGSRRGGRGAARSSRDRTGGESPDTAYFAPSIVTGADGRASVTFTLPEPSTTYRLIARGITKDSRAGEAGGELVVKSDFFAELQLPALLVEGDAPRLLARVFHAPEITGAAQLRLRVTAGGRTVSLPAVVDLERGEVVEHLFEALEPVPLADAAEIELVATATRAGEPLEHRSRARLAVRPFGVEMTDARGGELAASSSFFLELPRDVGYRARRLDLFVSPSAQRFLLDEALKRTPLPVLETEDLRALTQADAAGELYGVCAVLELTQRLVAASAAEARDLEGLRQRARSLLARLLATQQQDGGWPWAGAAGTDAPTSALSLAALAQARTAGFVVPAATVDAGIRFVETSFRAAPQQADELKSMLQFALALHERADFGALNRLHRARASLTSAGLAYVTLALVHSGKAPMAAEVAALLEQRAEPFTEPAVDACRWSVKGNGPWNRSGLEMAAIAVLALESASPRSPAIERGVSYLLAQRPWAPARAAGMVWAALARYWAAVVPERAEARVRVRVNDRDVESVRLAPGASAAHVAVPAELLADGRNKVELVLDGRAKPSFLAALRGFTADVKRRDHGELSVQRQALLAPAPIDAGRPLPTGFSIVSDVTTWENAVTEIPLGTLADVEVRGRFDRGQRREDEQEHWVLDLPLPAGVEVLDGSVSGDFLAFTQRPGGLLFDLGRREAWANVRFTLLGRVVGDWRVLPPTLRSSYDADRVAVGEPLTVRVLPRGAERRDPYRPTPDELYHRGKRAFDRGERAASQAPLEALLAQFGDDLRDAAFRDVARMLLFTALDSGDSQRIVRSFEVLKEKDPDFTLGFEPVLKVGAAYRALEEHERALWIERAIVDETFGKDLKVSGLLAQELQARDSFRLLERLWLEYPDSPAALQSYLALSDEMLTRAPLAHESRELRAQGLDRATLQREGMRILMRFLAFYPEDPLAPEAGLSLVSAWLGLEDFAAASELAGRLAKRFSEPRFADSFLYSKAVAEWSLGRDDDARAMLDHIATVEYAEPSGRRVPSINRSLASYIIAQIHHARHEAGPACAWYEKVRDEFADAREALDGIRQRELALPEVTVARPGERAEVTLTARNLEQADLLVYPVDLMTLCLREKNLSSIAGVNLAGVEPVIRTRVEIAGGAAKDAFLARGIPVALDLKKAGAYLVLARAEDRHASGLVLVSPLDLQVKEDADGRVRLHVVEHGSGRFVRDVEVKAIGSADESFQSGRTDPRGLFVADGVTGTATVIARRGADEYAFYRGTTSLGAAPQEDARTRNRAAAEAELQQLGYGEVDTYFKNVLDLNRDLQDKRKQQLQEEIGKDRKGVQLKKAQ